MPLLEKYFFNKSILRLILIIIFSIAYCLLPNAYSQGKTTKGKDFWFGYEDNRDPPTTKTASLHAYISADTNANCTITYSGRTFSFVVIAGITTDLSLPEDTLLNESSEQINNTQSVHITSNFLVSVFLLNYNTNSTDAAIVFPTPSLGNEYYTFCIDPPVPFQSSKEAQFLIVGVEDSTKIQINLAAVSFGGLPANTPYTITLNKGDVYQVKSQGDLTGSHIQILQSTCGKFAVFSGNRWNPIPPPNTSANNHLVEEMTPVNSWSKEYISAPFKTRSADYFRVLPSKDNTTIKLNGAVVATINRGQFYDATLSSANVFEGSNPICVMQYSRSEATDGVKYGDPMMIVLSPIEQSIKQVIFSSSTGLDFVNFFVNLVTKTNSTNLIFLDGVNVGSSFQPVPYLPNYSYADITVAQGNHVLKSDSGFTAYVYAFGSLDAYGYLAGTTVNNLSQRFNVVYNKDTILNSSFNKPVCPGDTVGFIASKDTNALSYTWNFGDHSAPVAGQITSHKFTTPGNFTVQLALTYPCDTEYVQMQIYVKKVVIHLSGITKICKGDTVTLSVNVTNSYTWSPSTGLFSTTGDTIKASPAYTVTYSIHAYDSKTCFSDSSFVLNVDNLQSQLYKDKSNLCFGDTVNIKINPNGVAPYSYKWSSSNDISSVLVINNSNGSGNQIIDTVTITDAYNCKNIKIDTITLLPDINIKIDKHDTSFCQGGSITFHANPASGLNYQWEINDTLVSGANQNTFTDTRTGKVTLFVTDNYKCKDTSRTVNVNVNPQPQAILIPDDTIATFCKGDTLKLSVRTDNGIKFQWKNNGVSIPNATNTFYIDSLPGNYSVLVINDSNCSNNSITIHIEISKPNAKITPPGPLNICKGSTVILNATYGAGLTYQWMKGDTLLTNQTNSFYPD